MGYLQEKHGIMMLKRTPEGTCSMCAVKHDPRLPHNRDSLAYQYNFYDQHGRFPSWVDAMAHCDPEIKAAWTQALEAKGVKVHQEPGTVAMEIRVGGEDGEEEVKAAWTELLEENGVKVDELKERRETQ